MVKTKAVEARLLLKTTTLTHPPKPRTLAMPGTGFTPVQGGVGWARYTVDLHPGSLRILLGISA